MGALFESAKCLTSSRKIDNGLLNRVGVQALRTTIARALYSSRGRGQVQNEAAEHLQKYGFVKIDRFLPTATFEVVKSEAIDLLEQTVSRQSPFDDSHHLKSVDLLKQTPELFPGLCGYLENEELKELFDVGERRDVDALTGSHLVEELLFGSEEHADSTPELRSDTFFHSHKAWLYLNDVKKRDGAVVYVPQSHRYNFCQMKHQYHEANHSNEGSRRISDQELQESKLNKVTLTGSANTLIVIDAAGYHGREKGGHNRRRTSIECSYQANPFFPFLSRRAKWKRASEKLGRRLFRS